MRMDTEEWMGRGKGERVGRGKKRGGVSVLVGGGLRKTGECVMNLRPYHKGILYSNA